MARSVPSDLVGVHPRWSLAGEAEVGPGDFFRPFRCGDLAEPSTFKSGAIDDDLNPDWDEKFYEFEFDVDFT